MFIKRLLAHVTKLWQLHTSCPTSSRWAELLQWPTRSPLPVELNGCYFSFQESFLQLWRLTTHYLSHSAYITVCLISAGNKVPIWFPNWESGQKRWDIFVATHKGKDTNFFFLLLKGLIWSSWDTKFTSGIRSWEKKKRRELKTTLHQRQWSNSCSLFGLDCSNNTHFQLLWHWTLYLQMC